MKLRIKREIPAEKLRAICPELFPTPDVTIEEVRTLREIVELFKLPGQTLGGFEGADVGVLIERVLDDYANLHERVTTIGVLRDAVTLVKEGR